MTRTSPPWAKSANPSLSGSWAAPSSGASPPTPDFLLTDSGPPPARPSARASSFDLAPSRGHSGPVERALWGRREGTLGSSRGQSPDPEVHPRAARPDSGLGKGGKDRVGEFRGESVSFAPARPGQGGSLRVQTLGAAGFPRCVGRGVEWGLMSRFGGESVLFAATRPGQGGFGAVDTVPRRLGRCRFLWVARSRGGLCHVSAAKACCLPPLDPGRPGSGEGTGRGGAVRGEQREG